MSCHINSSTAILFLLLTALLPICSPVKAQGERIVLLSNGMILGPGILTETGTITNSSFDKADGGASIGIMNDYLRKTYFNRAPVNTQSNVPYNGPPLIEFVLPHEREVETSGNEPVRLDLVNVSPFNKYGRRHSAVTTPRGQVAFLQGITHLTPRYFKLQTLRTEAKIVWDSREATATIPAADLRAILFQLKDLNSAADWLDIVSFYRQAERFTEAEEVMSEALNRFRSELADRQPLLTQIRQLEAEKRFEEIKLRQQSGQHSMAAQFLSVFPKDDLSTEAQVKLASEITKLRNSLALSASIAENLRTDLEALPAPDRQLVKPLLDELLGELTLSTLVRLDDYQRLRGDASLAAEDKIALALAGWLLDSGSGIDNFAVVKSLIRVRTAVQEYLSGSTPQRRQQILAQLRGEEGAQPAILAKLLATMKPPLQPPRTLEADPPGMHRIEVRTSQGDTVKYVVQVPPEYDPNRKYPCILALPGINNVPEMEINSWCGIYRKLEFASARAGYATRYGYIVVSPQWATETQNLYEYTESEHNRILTSLRDAFRKFSIDSDRVYCTGHFEGATAAWDLAIAHPDLWAGAVLICPRADKFIVHYHDNIRRTAPSEAALGTYIVYGEIGTSYGNSDLGKAASQYVQSSMHDSLVVEYIGRGDGLFLEETPRIFEWMELSSHRREFTPTRIKTKTMRAGDKYFYWLEAPSLLETVSQNAYQIDPAKAGKFEASFVRGQNTIRVSSIPSPKKSAVVWLSPDMVDFSRPITISLAGKGQRMELSPDIGVMLEDARTRADRQHAFWQRIALD